MKSWKIRIFVSLAVLVVLGGLAVGGYFYALQKAWIRYNEHDIRSEGLLTVGDLAPDLELASVDGSGSLHLSELYREKPLVVVFGSYT